MCVVLTVVVFKGMQTTPNLATELALGVCCFNGPGEEKLGRYAGRHSMSCLLCIIRRFFSCRVGGCHCSTAPAAAATVAARWAAWC